MDSVAEVARVSGPHQADVSEEDLSRLGLAFVSDEPRPTLEDFLSLPQEDALRGLLAVACIYRNMVSALLREKHDQQKREQM